MRCESCGREPENGTPTHWLGCPEILRTHARNLVEPDFVEALEKRAELLCSDPDCSEPRKEWSGKGARPKYCAAGHKKEKS